MTIFSHRSVTNDGELRTGTLECADRDSVLRLLQSQNLIPLRVQEARASTVSTLLQTELLPKRRVSAKKLSIFVRELATLADAGIPLDRALELLADRKNDALLRNVVLDLIRGLKEGRSLSSGLEMQAGIFPPQMIAMVRVGESDGSLAEVLADLADQLERSLELRNEIQLALIYPTLLIVTAIGSVAVMLGVVIPTFEPIFRQAGSDLPFLTKCVVFIASLIERSWYWLLPTLLILVVSWRLALRSDGGKVFFHSVALKLPLVGTVWRQSVTSEFSRVLGHLLQSGVSAVNALVLSIDTVGNAAIASKLRTAIAKVREGRGLSAAITEAKALPDNATRLIRVGQESDRLPQSLLQIAKVYETETRKNIKQLLAFLVPAITLVLGLMVAIVVASVLLAILKVNELAFS